MVDEPTKNANMVWHSVKVPDECKCKAILKLQKEGDLCDCDHGRGITLLIIANVMSSPTETIEKEEQAGIRHGRSCNEQILTLRNIIKQLLEYRKPLIINYAHFKKAF